MLPVMDPGGYKDWFYFLYFFYYSLICCYRHYLFPITLNCYCFIFITGPSLLLIMLPRCHADMFTWNILIKHIENIATLLYIYSRVVILVSLQIKLQDIYSHSHYPISINIFCKGKWPPNMNIILLLLFFIFFVQTYRYMCSFFMIFILIHIPTI